MFHIAGLLWFPLLAAVSAQQVGTQLAETHPNLSWKKCTAGGGCTVQSTGSVVLDANWRGTHSVNSTTNCYTGNTWDKTLCPDDVTCAKNCALDGANYAGTYGVTTSGDALTMKFVTKSASINVGTRLYFMASDTQYQMFQLLNSEFSFDVDVSQLPCGVNGALYFAQMDADGGMAKYPTNKAGAKYGTGYCDAQCPRDLKFVDGMANSEGWNSDTNSVNTGKGNYGICCNEMDIWEANSVSAAYTVHPCSCNGPIRCNGTACGGTTNRYGSICDPDGCDYNSYRMGATNFYGSGKTVDTRSKFTVITQFITDDKSSSGTLSEIRRIYVQNGAVIQNSIVNVPGIPSGNSITDAICTAQKVAFNDTNSFGAHGGLAGISKALDSGVVLVMSLWDDSATHMLWLDSNYPTNRSTSIPGTARGTCAATSGVPAEVEATNPNAQIVFSNIKFGPIGSTFT